MNPSPASSSPAEARARAFVEELARADWEHPRTPFDATMTNAMPATRLRELWENLEHDSGAFQGVEATSSRAQAGHQIAIVTCRFERLRKTLRVVFDGETKVAGLFHGPVPEDIEAKTRALIEATSQGKLDVAVRDFGKDMRAALPPASLGAVWRQLEGKAGRLKTIHEVELHPASGAWASLATAELERESIVVKVVYDARNEIVGLFFEPLPAAWSPPPYASSRAFTEREVMVGTAPALPGTLTVPSGAGPFAAVVLVHGSGPNDRDESVGAVKPFKDLAWGLANQGIAVLRYTKRSRHAPAGIVTQKEEVLDGAHEAIELLRRTPSVDPKRIFLAGHSQGGYLAPRIAEANESLAGVVILAGSTIPLEDSIIDQLTYFVSLDPQNTSVRSQLDAAKKFKGEVASADLRPDQELALPLGGSAKGAYFLDVRGYEPHVRAQKLTCRLLVLQGERDYQVTVAKDFANWRRALGAKEGATLTTYPLLNHLFVRGEGPPSPAEYQKGGHVDGQVVSDIAAWIKAAK